MTPKSWTEYAAAALAREQTESRAARVWAKLEATPGFNEEMAQATAELAAWGGTPWRTLRAGQEGSHK